MSEHAKSARAAMKAKAKRLGDAGDPKAKVDASSWSPPEMINAGAKTGMRPLSPRAYKRGGKVLHVEGDKTHHHAGRKPRASGGKTEMPLVDRFINADKKKANRLREGGEAHVGGYKHGGKAHKMGGGALYGLRATNAPHPLTERAARGYKHGGKTEHDDEAADRALIKKMVKPNARTGKKHGGESDKTLKRMHRASGGKNAEPKQFTDHLDVYEDPANRRFTRGPVTYAPGPEEPMTPPGRKRGGKAEHGAGCRCHKCWGGKAGKADGGPISSMPSTSYRRDDKGNVIEPKGYHIYNSKTGTKVGQAMTARRARMAVDKHDNNYGASVHRVVPAYGHGGVAGDPGGERPTGGRVARKDGGKVGKGKTNVNVIISTAPRPDANAMVPPGMPAPPPGAAPAMMPRQAPVMPPAPGGVAPGGVAPMPMPPPSAPPAGMMPPMGRKAGGRVYRSYKDMDAGAGSGLGRLEKTEIEKRK